MNVLNLHEGSADTTTEYFKQNILNTLGYFKRSFYMGSERLEPSAGLTLEEIVKGLLLRWKQSKEYQDATLISRYLRNDNAINAKQRSVPGDQGVPVPSQILANTKLPHPFLSQIASQKSNALLANGFTVNTGNKEYNEFLEEHYFNSEAEDTFAELVFNAISYGTSWLLEYYTPEGELNSLVVTPTNGVPIYNSNTKYQLDGFIRFYNVSTFDAKGGSKERLHVEYYCKQGVYILESENENVEGLTLKEIRPHFYLRNDSEVKDALWNDFPILEYRYSLKDATLFDKIKPLIDEYDEILSAIGDNIKDVPNSIKIVKGYSGTNPEEFVDHVAKYRVIFIAPEGDVSSLNTPVQVSEIEIYLTRLRKDIFEAANAIDIQTDQLGDVSGTALKFRFRAFLDDVNAIEQRLQKLLKQHLKFVVEDAALQGVKMDLLKNIPKFTFGVASLINEHETIENLVNSSQMISRETLLENHPYVKDVQLELSRLKKDPPVEKPTDE